MNLRLLEAQREVDLRVPLNTLVFNVHLITKYQAYRKTLVLINCLVRYVAFGGKEANCVFDCQWLEPHPSSSL